jgi:hypothetical protein
VQKKKGDGVLSDPWLTRALRRGQLGRIRAGGDEFWRSGGRNLQGNGGDCGDFGSPRLDSFGQEVEEDVAVLIS